MRYLWAIGVLLGFALAAPVQFSYTPPAGVEVRTVSLRGQFNNWSETPLKLTGKTWSVTVDLPPGKHPYKFFINGQWPRNMCDGQQYAVKDGKIDLEAEACVDDGNGGFNAVRTVSGEATPQTQTKAVAKPAPALKEGMARVHYARPDENYDGWGLHLWMDTLEEPNVTWAKPFPPTGQDDYGLYWDFRLKDGAKKVGFIVHKADAKDPGPDMFLETDKHGREVWILSGSATIYTQKPDASSLPKGDLGKAQAYWLTRDLIAWNPEGYTAGAQVKLYYSLSAGLKLSRDGVGGGLSVTLEPSSLSPELKASYPHLARLQAFKLSKDDSEKASGLVKNQTAVVALSADGKLLDATSLQLAGVLDDLYAYDGPLGVEWKDGTPTLRVWAPTARSVSLLLFDKSSGGEARTFEMREQNGVWSVAGEASWKNKFYLYEARVYVRATGKMETHQVTDPYSVSLSTNSKRSQIVDLNDTSLKPRGWDTLKKPALEAFEDAVLYELQVRDFSASDATVPANLRGTFKAFTVTDSNGMKHLKKLADAGLTHIHLLPAFDIASINEDKTQWKSPGDLAKLPRDSDEQQKAVNAIQDRDGFNWGYDPLHFSVPEGSYSTNPDGSERVLEFREMVAALSGIGLRTVMDVVYNHTTASGLADNSVLDKIVPDYYHRLNKDGLVETSTCCQNTASENRMMEKLLIDSVVLWARQYKVDGFRFDLMGHHMKANLEALRKTLDALTLEKDGVDGKKIILYGEGWDFGEVAHNARGVNASQTNMAGTGIGTFNDRLRDAARGGGPFGDPRDQGFISGLFTAPNLYDGSSSDLQRRKLLEQTQWIRVGLAGGLREYPLTPDLTGGQVNYNGAPAGYTADPQESINYVSAHDNETLFDAVMYKAPSSASLAERIRMNNLGLALVMLGQGIPFFHAGDDLLRSKSGDRNSYDSGDWFNRLDWSYQSNNWGVGLPLQGENGNRYNYLRPLLANPALVAQPAEIQGATAYFQELLKIRKSSPLFRLRTARDVQNRLAFPAQDVPGVIVMGLNGQGLESNYAQILVIFNATPTAFQYKVSGNWQLHPLQRDSADPLTRQASVGAGGLSVPGRTTAVFVLPR